MAEPDLASFTLNRHPGIPSPTAAQVLRSGILGIDEQRDVIRNVGWYEINEGLPGRGKKLGRAWYFHCLLGTVVIPEKSQQMFKVEPSYRFEGRKFEAARLAITALDFDRQAGEITERAIVLPHVDRVQDAKTYTRVLLAKTSCHYMLSQDQAGVVRDFSVNADNEYLAPPPTSYVEALDMRWAREFEALTVQVLDEALGASFWPDMQQKLRDNGLRSVPVDDLLTYAHFMNPLTNGRPRVLDGPMETRTHLITETMAALERAGFTATTALAALYLYESAFEMPLPQGRPGESTWIGALQDQKFAAALRDRWQPTHQGWLDISAKLRGTPREYEFPAHLENWANGTWKS